MKFKQLPGTRALKRAGVDMAHLKTLAKAVAAGTMSLAAAVHAAVPASVTTGITDTGADLVTVITAVIVAFIAFWGLRKLGAKMGWL